MNFVYCETYRYSRITKRSICEKNGRKINFPNIYIIIRVMVKTSRYDFTSKYNKFGQLFPLKIIISQYLSVERVKCQISNWRVKSASTTLSINYRHPLRSNSTSFLSCFSPFRFTRWKARGVLPHRTLHVAIVLIFEEASLTLLVLVDGWLFISPLPARSN